MKEVTCKLIEIIWKGPYNLTEARKNYQDSGLYQIYGTHPVYGRDSLLYLGKTKNSFGERINSHLEEWIKYEYDDVKIYHGIIETKIDSDLDITTTIAEKLLIYYCAPGYNSNEIADLKINRQENIVLLNYGKIGSLPPEVSNLWYNSSIWDKISSK